MHHMQFFYFFFPGERSISAVASFPIALIITVALSFSPSMSSRRSRVEAVNDFSLKDGKFLALPCKWARRVKSGERARPRSQIVRSRADKLSDRQVAMRSSLGQVSDVKAGYFSPGKFNVNAARQAVRRNQVFRQVVSQFGRQCRYSRQPERWAVRPAGRLLRKEYK